MLINRYEQERKMETSSHEDDIFLYLADIDEPGRTRLSKEANALITTFLIGFAERVDPDQCVHLCDSCIGVFNTLRGSYMTTYFRDFFWADNWEKIERSHKNSNRKVVFGDFSGEWSRTNTSGFQSLENTASIISGDDVGVFSMDGDQLSGRGVGSARHSLREKGLFITAFIFLPRLAVRELFTEETSSIDEVLPFGEGLYLVIVQRAAMAKQFVAEFDTEESVADIIANYFGGQSGDTFCNGIWLDADTFFGMDNWRARREIARSKNNYEQYESRKLHELLLGSMICSPTKEEFKSRHQQNSSYIPVYKDDQYIMEVADVAFVDGQGEYLRLDLDPKFILSEYAECFLSSHFGKLILTTHVRSSRHIPLGKREDIDEVDLYFPDLARQRVILSTIHKIAEVDEKFSDFRFDTILDPVSFKTVAPKIDKILEIFGELADYEKVKLLISEGESKTLEFKQTLSLDIKKGTKERYIENAAIKTVAAFLNSNGGILLIGVDDSGAICGVDEEAGKFHKSRDKFLLHFKNQIKDRIGEQWYPFIDQKLVPVGDKIILSVECLQSKSEVYVDQKDFYVRTNPATDKLEGPKLVAYIRNHFEHP